jgi:hypothetical protein
MASSYHRCRQVLPRARSLPRRRASRRTGHAAWPGDQCGVISSSRGGDERSAGSAQSEARTAPHHRAYLGRALRRGGRAHRRTGRHQRDDHPGGGRCRPRRVAKIIDFAKRNRLVPAGKRIEKTRATWGERRIRLLDGPHANVRRDSGTPIVSMPTELRNLHPSGDGRAARLWPAKHGGKLASSLLAVSARLDTGSHPSRAHGAGATNRRPSPWAHNHHGRPGVPDYSRREGELKIVVDGFAYRVTIDQEHPEAKDDERYEQLFVWVRGPGQHLGSRTRWHDGKRPPSTTRSGRSLTRWCGGRP